MNKLLSEVLRPTTFEEITIPDDIKKRLIPVTTSLEDRRSFRVFLGDLIFDTNISHPDHDLLYD